MGEIAWYLYVAVIAAGFAAGFINTVAGSGSLITLPLLIFLGLPATVANGTNRVAILLQNVVGVSSYRQQKILDFRGGLILALPALVGAIVGARIAVDLDEVLMRRVIGGLMVLMLIVMMIRPNRWLTGQVGEPLRRFRLKESLVFFAIGVYGGFIQAGVGIFLLAGLVLGAGYDLVRANAIKVFIVLIYTPLALAIFVFNHQVHWGMGLTLAVGNMLGALVASRLAVRKGAPFVRFILIAVIVVSAIKFLGIWDYVLSTLNL